MIAAREPSADELFDRSLATLVESWRYLAGGSPGAEVTETDGAAIAVFVHSPDREFLNNVVLAQGIEDLDAALSAAERAYARRGIERYAVWVHESEVTAAREVEDRGYAYDSSTRTMAMPIAELGADVDTSVLDLIEPAPERFWRLGGLDGLAPDLPAEPAHFYICRHNGEDAAMLMAFDHDGDCGIYMVGTQPPARRRGLATALSAHAIERARERGCATASLQSTAMAEGVYARVGFHDLGRFHEYTPTQASKEKEK
ncbi:MAG TPA: GNAT family N-acetyltransferase [Solirubrobacterales bacterium]|nr:GNAT family N-acetyltransferase [Solirubrobacterales bacterium]